MPKVHLEQPEGVIMDTDRSFPEKFEKEGLPHDPGVYVIIDLDKDEVFYIGEAKDLYSRLNEQDHDGLDYAEDHNMNYCIRVQRRPEFNEENFREIVEKNLMEIFKPTWEEIKKSKKDKR